MTLIKKSDVHNHLSAKSRERREKAHPYQAGDQDKKTSHAVDTPNEASSGNPVAAPKHFVNS
ncbi:MAG TPA: hypothetical protein VHT24_10310 [Pseudacidobacterium sp.]|jgi:hypothetical protein|nr:hypothetical protein [Pseudacidobacterium sp.]